MNSLRVVFGYFILGIAQQPSRDNLEYSIITKKLLRIAKSSSGLLKYVALSH